MGQHWQRETNAGQTTHRWYKYGRERDQKPEEGKELYLIIKCTVHLPALHIIAAWIALVHPVIQCVFVLVAISNVFMLSPKLLNNANWLIASGLIE